MTGPVADRDAIAARMSQVYGSASACARFCGVSRQSLDRRVRSATRWSLTHAWWALVLCIDTRLDGLTPQAIVQVQQPTLDQLNQVWALQASVWQVAHARRNTRRSAPPSRGGL